MQEEKRSSASFRLYHCHNRSKSILLHSSEFISAECDSLTTYQRLSQSMRLPDELPVDRRKRKALLVDSSFWDNRKKMAIAWTSVKRTRIRRRRQRKSIQDGRHGFRIPIGDGLCRDGLRLLLAQIKV